MCSLACAHTLRAQTEASDFARIGFGAYLTSVVSDYQCVGINPANLGFVPKTDVFVLATPLGGGVERQRRAWSFSIAEGGATAHSDALTRGGLMNALFNNGTLQFTLADKRKAAADFAGKGIRFSADIFSAAAAFQTNAFGGISITARERAMGTFKFNEAAASLAFEGRYYSYFDSLSTNFRGDTVGFATHPRPFSELFDGTRLAMSWFRELGISYGIGLYKSEDLDVYVGAGLKYMMAYAYLDAFVEDGQLKAYSSLSPFFGISYGKAISPSFIPGKAFEPIGDGWGLDLGLTVRVDKFTFSASVVDLGAIRYDGNVFVAKDTILNGMSSTGFASYNIFEEAPKITGDGNYFSWDGLATATSELPSRLRIGASYAHTYRWRFGIDVVTPINQAAGSLGESIVSVGADWRPTLWLRVGGGIGGGGNMGIFLPASVMFSVFGGFWEFGISSRDIITLVAIDRPVVSLTIGLARIRF